MRGANTSSLLASWFFYSPKLNPGNDAAYMLAWSSNVNELNHENLPQAWAEVNQLEYPSHVCLEAHLKSDSRASQVDSQ